MEKVILVSGDRHWFHLHLYMMYFEIFTIAFTSLITEFEILRVGMSESRVFEIRLTEGDRFSADPTEASYLAILLSAKHFFLFYM